MIAELTPPFGRASKDLQRELYSSRMRSGRGSRGVENWSFKLKIQLLKGEWEEIAKLFIDFIFISSLNVVTMVRLCNVFRTMNGDRVDVDGLAYRKLLIALDR